MPVKAVEACGTGKIHKSVSRAFNLHHIVVGSHFAVGVGLYGSSELNAFLFRLVKVGFVRAFVVYHIFAVAFAVKDEQTVLYVGI